MLTLLPTLLQWLGETGNAQAYAGDLDALERAHGAAAAGAGGSDEEASGESDEEEEEEEDEEGEEAPGHDGLGHAAGVGVP